MKPAISYYGGKQRIASKIVPLIPLHMLYCEPFAGGLAVLFAKGRPLVTNANYYHEIINDTDERLINFYRTFQAKFPELMQRLAFTPMSEAEYKRSKAMLADSSASEVDRAWAYYIQIQQSFSNKLGAGWARRAQVPGKNEAARWKNGIDNLAECFQRLSLVQIACTDAIKCIQQFDSKDAFFYCDPPYPGTHQGHYGGYTLEDFQRLVECLASIKGQFILSNYDQPSVLFPSHWVRKEIETVMSASGGAHVANKKRTEVLWMSQPKQESLLCA